MVDKDIPIIKIFRLRFPVLSPKKDFSSIAARGLDRNVSLSSQNLITLFSSGFYPFPARGRMLLQIFRRKVFRLFRNHLANGRMKRETAVMEHILTTLLGVEVTRWSFVPGGINIFPS
ncbi:MAG: hypothetical protein LOD92_01150 [Bacillales bacterium]